MNKLNSFPIKITIMLAITSVILFKVFNYVSLKILSGLRIDKLIFDIDFRILILSLIELLGVILFFYFINKKLLIPKNTNLIFYLLSVLLGVLYVFSQEYLNLIYDIFFGTNYKELVNYNLQSPRFTKLFVAQVIIIPVAEEMFFRKYIQNGLKINYNNVIAICISSILFALAHLPDYHNTFVIFFGGLISAILYSKSKSVISSVIFHVTWNMTIFIT